jgi:hypothetical protein
VNRSIFLGLIGAIIIIAIVGVVVASSYRTNVEIIKLNENSINGKYLLQVQVFVNYGLFGGSKPLQGTIIWIFKDNKFYSMNFTNNNGIAEFYLPPGNYSIYFVQFNYYVKNVIIEKSGLKVILNYAYLYKS